MSEKHLTSQSFEGLDLPEPLLMGIRAAGFEHCTPIQAEALPPALAGQDVAGQAQTGTGKTAAFLIAAYAHLLRHPAAPRRRANQPRALMLAPTRELAIQIHKDAEVIGSSTGLTLGLAYGGTGYEKQRTELERGVDVLIGTPGRLIDYFKQRVFDLQAIQVLVLDEADRMFDLGFIRDIRYLLRAMPPPSERLSMLFSATLSLRVNELAYEHMNNPLVVKIESERLTVDQVTEQVFFPSNDEKISLLLTLLADGGATRTLIFVNTKYGAERLERWLQGNGYQAGVLSGDVPQRKRERLLQDFKDGKVPILVATDVAARGLHIPDVSHVINYDLPQDAEDYVHRIGRTARAGASGDAISFACETYAFSLADIEDYLGHKIPTRTLDPDLLTTPQPATPASPRRRAPGRGKTGGRAKSAGSKREGQPAGSGRRRRSESGAQRKTEHSKTRTTAPERDADLQAKPTAQRKTEHSKTRTTAPERDAGLQAKPAAQRARKRRRGARETPAIG